MEKTRPKEIRNHFPIRLIGCSFALIETLILYAGTGEISYPAWVFIVGYFVLFPILTFKFTQTGRQEFINVVMDCMAYSVFLVIWGANPFLTFVMFSGIILTSLTALGVKGLFITLAACAVAMLVTLQLWPFQYRPELTLFNTIYAAAAMLLFMGCLGYLFYKIARTLLEAKEKQTKQRQHLEFMSEVALAVNSTLDLDSLMLSLSESLGKRYPIESTVMTALSEDNEYVDVIGVYGDAFNATEIEGLTNLHMHTTFEAESLFVGGLIHDRVIYVPLVDEGSIDKFSTLDRRLYDAKPLLSVAYFPVKVHGRVVAGVAFFNYKESLILSESDIAEISSYLVQVGTAVKNIRLYQIAQQQKQKAEESERAKSHFLANMSHEIRTPMTAILGYSEALQDDNISKEERKEFTQTIINGGHHLLSIINDVLDISKIEANKFEVEMLDVNLPLLIKDIDSNIKLKAHEKGLNYELHVQYPIPFEIRIDPTRIKQILFNLASNAVKFTEKGFIKIYVSWNNGRLGFCVEDSGIGLTEDEQKKLFKAFSQADSSTTRLYGGTGLGLHISKSLAQLMSGDLYVESEKDKGSRFSVELSILHDFTDSWVQNDEEMQRCLTQLQDDEPTEHVPQLSGQVLVADDTEQNQILIRRLMVKAGLDVDVVSNGQQALEHALANDYQLILLDIQMPVMGGEDALEAMRDQGVACPVIAFTANVMQHQVEQYKKQSFNDVLEKPISRLKLYSMLESHLKQSALNSVLVVDDNDVNRMVLSRYVTKMITTAHVDYAEDGQKAVDKLKSRSYDLIFMDMEMPVMGGLEATQTLREMGINTPVYMVTGNTDLSYVRQATEVGAQGHLAKPINRDSLNAILQKHS